MKYMTKYYQIKDRTHYLLWNNPLQIISLKKIQEKCVGGLYISHKNQTLQKISIRDLERCEVD